MSRPKGSKNKKFPPINGKDLPSATPFRLAPNIKLTLKSMGRVFQSEAPTFEEAVDKIKISGGARATSVIKVEKDGKEIIKILNARYANGLFGQGSPTMKLICLKGVKQILGV